jgi:hypothetical protein
MIGEQHVRQDIRLNYQTRTKARARNIQKSLVSARFSQYVQ